MIIDALKFRLKDGEAEPEKVQGGPRELADKPQDGPIAYVVRNDDLGALPGLKDLVEAKGEKKPHIELSRLLLGCQKVPYITGSYSHAGQLKRSVRDLLSNATTQGEINAYIIGVSNMSCLKLRVEEQQPSIC